MKTINGILGLWLLSSVTLIAVEINVLNLSGTNVGVALDGVPYVVAQGQYQIEQTSVSGILITYPDGSTNWFDLSGVDLDAIDRFEVLCGAAGAQMAKEGRSRNLWAVMGFGFGITVFGFSWVLRIVRGVGSTGGEL